MDSRELFAQNFSRHFEESSNLFSDRFFPSANVPSDPPPVSLLGNILSDLFTCPYSKSQDCQSPVMAAVGARCPSESVCCLRTAARAQAGRPPPLSPVKFQMQRQWW
eukprot:EG_transcript_24585